MRYCILLSMLFVLQCNLLAQTIKSTFQIRTNRQGNLFWHLDCRTSLPEGTKLVAALAFENHLLPQSRSFHIVHRQRFSLSYGAITKNIPSGLYTWKIQSCQGGFTQGLPYHFSFYHGSPYQKREEIKENALFYQQLTMKIQLFLKDVVKIMDRSKQRDAASVRLIVIDFHHRFRVLRQQINVFFSRKLFPRDPTCYRNLQMLTMSAEKLLKFYTVKILTQSKLAVPSHYQKVHENPVILMHKINHQINAIKKRLRLPKNLSANDLQEDILWFNQIFQTMHKNFQANRKKGRFEKWKQATATVIPQLEGFRRRVKDYSASKLSARYGKLLKALTSVNQQGIALYHSYTEQLLHEMNPKFPKANLDAAKIIKTLKLNLVVLMGIIDEVQQKSVNLKDKAKEYMQKNIRYVQSNYQDLQHALTLSHLQKYSDWFFIWKSKQDKSMDMMLKWRGYFPSQARLLRRAILWLNLRAANQKKLLNLSQQNLTMYKARLKQQDNRLKFLMNRLATELLKRDDQ